MVLVVITKRIQNFFIALLILLENGYMFMFELKFEAGLEVIAESLLGPQMARGCSKFRPYIVLYIARGNLL